MKRLFYYSSCNSLKYVHEWKKNVIYFEVKNFLKKIILSKTNPARPVADKTIRQVSPFCKLLVKIMKEATVSPANNISRGTIFFRGVI
jgi:hypothetical protein